MTKETPLVSVVIPVRNGREYIHEAISSVLNQSYSNIELIIVDDGSTDFDYQTLTNVDPRIRTIRLEGSGVSRARNIGMTEAHGQYIAFLDADDIWFPGKLEAQIRYLRNNPNVGCVFGRFIKWHPDEYGIFRSPKTLSHDCSKVNDFEKERSGWLYTRLLMGLLVGMNTAIIQRKVFDLLGGFDESMRIGEDYLFWLKVSRIYEMHSLDAIVALYRIHDMSAMSRLDKENHQAKLLNIAINRWGLSNPDGTFLAKDKFHSRLAQTEFTHGYNHYWNGHPEIAAEAFKRACIGGALRLRSSIYFTLSQLKLLGIFIKTYLNKLLAN